MGKFIQYGTKESQYNGPFDSKVGWSAAGMGDVIVTENGKLIVVDGGCRNDAEALVSLLEAQCEGKKPEIDTWIITHPHGDHYGALQQICGTPELADRISVKSFIYWFPMEFCNKDGVSGVLEYGNKDMEEICRVTGADSRRPARDEKLNVDGTEIHFLYVPDDCSVLNTAGGNSNHCSLIFTVQGKDKKVMVTGDAYGRSMQITAWRYHRALKCDILQMPHHALCDSYCVDFYRYVNAETVLMPISIAGYRAMHSGMYEKSEGCIANLCVEARADKVYKAFDGTVELCI
ncbi:MAG: MBL fold metallo-hydrolase [Clostridia bacterium]|nr:MBL fold metallo-hydrolase [Clostridia bacterium]